MTAPDRLSVSPQLGVPTPGKPLSRARIERLFSRIIATFGLVFAVQIIPGLTDAMRLLAEPWTLVSASVLLATMVWVVVAAMAQRGVSLSMRTAAVVYVASLLTWPLLVTDVSSVPATPWLWYLCTVATAYAAIAFSVPVAAIYTVSVPVVYGVLRASPYGGDSTLTGAVLDVVYAVILGGALLILVTMVRQAASGVDAAQAAALDRYSAVAREHASEAERAEVDAIVHDSVLTTLLAAAGASSPEVMAVAARMATEAIGHLDAAAGAVPVDGAVLGLDRLSERISSAARSFSAPFDFSQTGVTDAPIPTIVADALHAAAVQAMVNSLQHAGRADAHRCVSIVGLEPQGVQVSVMDDGVGFDPAAVGAERLGLRVSILERVARVGGEVTVRSAPGEGATIVLSWGAGTTESGAAESALASSGSEASGNGASGSEASASGASGAADSGPGRSATEASDSRTQGGESG
ncbi:MAG: ATP-binding protein [Microbacteriaceae bacterium]|nr:MAG: ATP-binding protein [Microbacteriaceae bacterium]